MIKLFNNRIYFLLNRKPKAKEKFFEFGRSSYENRIFQCIGTTDNFVFSGNFYKNTDINHPFPENCKPVLFSLPLKFSTMPSNGDHIRITWLPNNGFHRNAYIGSEGIVHNVSKDGFELKMETAWLIVGHRYKFEKIL